MAPLTEYRRKYKQKGEACQRDYVIRYNYMIGRRSTEMSHTPLDWDVASDTESDASSSRSEHNCSSKKGKDQLHTSVQRPSVSVPQKVTAVEPKSNVNEVATQVDKTEIKSALDCKETKTIEKCKCAINANKMEKQQKNLKSKHDIKTQKEKTKHQISRPISEMKVKPPLLPYGWAYRGPIDNHKTFNVQVPEKEACPSALRAMKRRQLDIQRREEEKHHQNLMKKRTEALFNFIEKDKNGWMSEYQRNFSGNKFAN